MQFRKLYNSVTFSYALVCLGVSHSGNTRLKDMHAVLAFNFPYQGTAGRVSISGSHRESLKLIQLYPFVLLWSVDGQLWAGDLKKLLKEMGGLE